MAGAGGWGIVPGVWASRPGPASIPLLFCRRGFVCFVFLGGATAREILEMDGWMDGWVWVGDQGIGASGLPIAPPAAPPPVCLFAPCFFAPSPDTVVFFLEKVQMMFFS